MVKLKIPLRKTEQRQLQNYAVHPFASPIHPAHTEILKGVFSIHSYCHYNSVMGRYKLTECSAEEVYLTAYLPAACQTILQSLWQVMT